MLICVFRRSAIAASLKIFTHLKEPYLTERGVTKLYVLWDCSCSYTVELTVFHNLYKSCNYLISALQERTVLLDRSHWGVQQLVGEDRQRFLHSQTSNAFTDAAVLQAVPSCVLMPTGRTVDLCDAVLLQSESR
jgi:glycine cleavage system aminomethyltransferase T